MGAGNGVHLHHLIVEIFVLNLKDQKTDFTGTNLHNQAILVPRCYAAAPHQSVSMAVRFFTSYQYKDLLFDQDCHRFLPVR